jgi:hypothetical protein
MSKKLGCLKWWWLGVFIAPTTKRTVGEAVCRWAHRTVRCTIGHCPLRQPSHPTVRVLTVSTVGALIARCTGQALFTVRCAFGRCSDSARTVCTLFTFAGDRWSRPLRFLAVAPLAHRTVRWIIAERLSRNPKVKSSAYTVPGAPDTVRWHTGQSGAPDQSSLQFLLLLSFEP